jgi:hypothetical protein
MYSSIPRGFLSHLETGKIHGISQRILNIWPEGFAQTLLSEKILLQKGVVKEFLCPSCGEMYPVYWGGTGKHRRAFIHCHEDGRYLLEKEELNAYSIDLEQLVKRIAGSLDLDILRCSIQNKEWELLFKDNNQRYVFRIGSRFSMEKIISETNTVFLSLGLTSEIPKNIPDDISFVDVSRYVRFKNSSLVVDKENLRANVKVKVKDELSPALTQTQHCDVWGIGIAKNIFSKNRPARKLWDTYKREDKTAPIPLNMIHQLLLNYWSRKGDATRAPANEQETLELYIKKGFADKSR